MARDPDREPMARRSVAGGDIRGRPGPGLVLGPRPRRSGRTSQRRRYRQLRRSRLAATGELSRGGRHFESGYAVATGKRVLIAGPREHAFQFLTRVEFVDNAEGADIAHVLLDGQRQLPLRPSRNADVYVIVRKEDEILLLLRSGTGYKDNQWGPPSGKVEPDETYTEAAVRELAEETGIRVGPEALRFVHFIERAPTSGIPWAGAFFEVTIADASPRNTEPQKHSDLGFFPIADLPEATVDYVQHAIHATASGRQFSEWRYLESEVAGSTSAPLLD